MDLGLNGKVVLITGGSKGIGLACAKAFLAEGAKVAIVSRSKVNLVAADRQLKAAGQAGEVVKVAADLIDPANARRMTAEVEQALGPIDVLVNSAGAAKRTPADDLTPEAWRAAMDAKYFTYVHAIDAVIKAWRRASARDRDVIARAARSRARRTSGRCGERGAHAATAGLANAYGGRGIRVNAVNPGATLTDRLKQGMEADAKAAGITPDEALQRATARVALGRLAEPDEIANVVLFLASDKASYVSGAVIAMDGAAVPIVV
jgi:NAD(P)-dependent dehydrogenase (short-subunit alcohol dehydrogenase family)